MLQQKPPLITKISSKSQQCNFLLQTLQQLTYEHVNKTVTFNVNCQAQLGEISQRHQHANLALSTNMLGHKPTVVG